MMVMALCTTAVPATASNATDCTGIHSGVTYDRLEVPVGRWCQLNNVTVTGTVTVYGGLIMHDSTIGKHLFGRDALAVRVYDTDIGGQVQISGTTGTVWIGASQCEADPVAGGNIHVHHNHGIVVICEMNVRNNILVQQNDNASGQSYIEVGGNTVGNNINVLGNDTQLIRVVLNDVSGNINVHQNNTSLNWLAIRWNDIGGNLNCQGNNPAPVTSGNTVGGHFIGQC